MEKSCYKDWLDKGYAVYELSALDLNKKHTQTHDTKIKASTQPITDENTYPNISKPDDSISASLQTDPSPKEKQETIPREANIVNDQLVNIIDLFISHSKNEDNAVFLEMLKEELERFQEPESMKDVNLYELANQINKSHQYNTQLNSKDVQACLKYVSAKQHEMTAQVRSKKPGAK